MAAQCLQVCLPCEGNFPLLQGNPGHPFLLKAPTKSTLVLVTFTDSGQKCKNHLLKGNEAQSQQGRNSREVNAWEEERNDNEETTPSLPSPGLVLLSNQAGV